eukprot:TRINITY_DN4628_c0_g1_i11.p1 TRINITY_DN4628_c0_g1~~TRINITY_DN4628_c0_g1_i11.p1  ORF type:complete len:207 (-),score=0.20 TRINITY_DN4628_c0_g1_i11:281-901(-)
MPSDLCGCFLLSCAGFFIVRLKFEVFYGFCFGNMELLVQEKVSPQQCRPKLFESLGLRKTFSRGSQIFPQGQLIQILIYWNGAVNLFNSFINHLSGFGVSRFKCLTPLRYICHKEKDNVVKYRIGTNFYKLINNFVILKLFDVRMSIQVRILYLFCIQFLHKIQDVIYQYWNQFYLVCTEVYCDLFVDELVLELVDSCLLILSVCF